MPVLLIFYDHGDSKEITGWSHPNNVSICLKNLFNYIDKKLNNIIMLSCKLKVYIHYTKKLTLYPPPFPAEL